MIGYRPVVVFARTARMRRAAFRGDVARAAPRDVLERCLRALETGECTAPDVARELGVTPAMLRRWLLTRV